MDFEYRTRTHTNSDGKIITIFDIYYNNTRLLPVYSTLSAIELCKNIAITHNKKVKSINKLKY